MLQEKSKPHVSGKYEILWWSKAGRAVQKQVFSLILSNSV